MLNKIREQMMGYSIKGLKSMQGHEGIAWQGNIYKNGVKVAFAHDDGWGGMVDIRYENVAAETQFKKDAKIAFPDFEYEFDGAFAGLIADSQENLAKITRQCKKATLIQLKSDNDPDSYRSIKLPFSAEVASKVRAKYGVDLLAIINEQL